LACVCVGARQRPIPASICTPIACRQGGRAERLVVHVVNYRVPILLDKGAGPADDPTWSPVTKSGEPVVLRNLRIAVSLPDAAKVERVEALSPTEAAAR